MRTKKIIRIVALLAVLGSLAVLAGWNLNVYAIKSPIPNELDVLPNCALCFILCGLCLFLLTIHRAKAGLFLLAVSCLLIFLIGGITVLQFFSGINTGIDNIFRPFINPATAGLSLRMAPGTAMCFTLLGPAFLLISSSQKKFQTAGQFMLDAVSLMATIAIIGYLYRAPALYKQSVITPMAIRTSLSLFVISVSTSFIHPRLGLTGLLTGPNMGNVMARRLLPPTLIAIFLIGYLRLQTMRLHTVGDQFGIMLVFVAILLVALFIILNTASVLNKTDVQRIEAKEEVDTLNQNLEHTNKELQETMQKLEANNQYLEQLAYISSHDIKSPILTLKGLVEALDKEGAVKEEYREMLSMITGTVNQMQRTNNSLNNILKLRKNLLTPEMDTHEAYTLQTILADIKAMLRHEIAAANAVIELHIDSLPETNFPYVHVKSMFYNLISNSLKYRDYDRPLIIKLSAKQLNNHAFEFCFEDNGIGIDIERNKDKMFGIFKRFHDHVEGSGVGLHIVKSIVEAYGGNISVDSEPGKGTRFIITWNNPILAA